MPSDESKGSQLDAIGSLAQRQLDNTAQTLQGRGDRGDVPYLHCTSEIREPWKCLRLLHFSYKSFATS